MKMGVKNTANSHEKLFTATYVELYRFYVNATMLFAIKGRRIVYYFVIKK